MVAPSVVVEIVTFVPLATTPLAGENVGATTVVGFGSGVGSIVPLLS